MKKCILLALCLALLLTLSGCDLIFLHDSGVSDAGLTTEAPSGEPSDAPPMSTTIETSAPSESKNYAPTGIQIPDEETAIVLLYNRNADGYSFRVPQLNCQTPDAARINAEIAETYGTIVEEWLVGSGTSCIYIDFDIVWCSNTLALIVYREYPGACRYFSVYNFDSITGSEVTNAQLLSDAGLDDETFVSLAKARAVAVFDEKYKNAPDIMTDYAAEKRESSASDEFINPDMRMYLSENGSLMLISPIGSLAGADYYEEIYPLFP